MSSVLLPAFGVQNPAVSTVAIFMSSQVIITNKENMYVFDPQQVLLLATKDASSRITISVVLVLDI